MDSLHFLHKKQRMLSFAPKPLKARLLGHISLDP